MVLVNLFEPGKALHIPLPDSASHSDVTATGLSLKDFVAHTFPTSVIDAMARNEILQIVLFSLFFGSAAAALGERARALVDMVDALAHIMLKVTSYVMLFAPLAVFGALAATVAQQGLGILRTYGVFIGEFYFGLAVLWAILTALGGSIIGKRVLALVRGMRDPLLLAFSTASSEAAYPKTLEQLERFGCSNKIASFVLPIGYSFNLDGSMMYCTFASLFIAQAYGIHLSAGQQILMLAILMLTSKGIAGVPRASLVVIAATLPQFNIPEGGLLLLLGIDHFLDMGRSATNVDRQQRRRRGRIQMGRGAEVRSCGQRAMKHAATLAIIRPSSLEMFGLASDAGVTRRQPPCTSGRVPAICRIRAPGPAD